MNDPLFILSYVVLFGGMFAFGFLLLWLDNRSKRKSDHPAPGE